MITETTFQKRAEDCEALLNQFGRILAAQWNLEQELKAERSEERPADVVFVATVEALSFEDNFGAPADFALAADAIAFGTHSGNRRILAASVTNGGTYAFTVTAEAWRDMLSNGENWVALLDGRSGVSSETDSELPLVSTLFEYRYSSHSPLLELLNGI